jgi:hypothetical protein
MIQRPRHLGDLFSRIGWIIAVLLAGCGSNVTPSVENDAGTDAATPGDVQWTDVPSSGFGDNGSNTAVVCGSITSDAGVDGRRALGTLLVTGTVAATMADGVVSADDPAGLLMQDGLGAIFVAVDPATLSPPPVGSPPSRATTAWVRART